MRRAGNAVVHDTAPRRKFRDRLISMRMRIIVLAAFSQFLSEIPIATAANLNTLDRDNAIGMNLDQYQYDNEASDGGILTRYGRR